jgi:hypothetical protein
MVGWVPEGKNPGIAKAHGQSRWWGSAQRDEKPLGAPHYRFDRIGFRDYNFRSGQKPTNPGGWT